jgi:hypothetical protein
MQINNIFALTMFLILCGIMWYTTTLVKRGKIPYIRKIPALDAIEEAVGRCVEMGRPVYYPLGAAGFGDAWTGGKMAALSLINYTATLCAERGIKLLTGTTHTALIPMIDDVVSQAYSNKGIPELHNISDIRWFPSQMAYVAGTDTIFKYEKPGAQIMIDTWWAEALAFCEIGRRAGAFQIGGTDYRPYMPYFIATCDYALIGEEIFIASAYINPEPGPKATVYAEDLMKFLLIGITIAFAILVSVGFTAPLSWLNM